MAKKQVEETGATLPVKKEVAPVKYGKIVTMVAPKGAKYHKEGKEIRISPVFVAVFQKKGYTVK